MKEITTVGVDLAKVVFTVHGVDAGGRIALRKTVRREKLMELIAGLPPCLIGMEACGGAHEWARRFEACGHRVGIMMARFVAPYRKSSKNDGNDAEAICEAVARPNMRFVPVKSAEQQAVLSLHRVRQGFIEQRTATINRIRGLLAEFGMSYRSGPTRCAEQRSSRPKNCLCSRARPLPICASTSLTATTGLAATNSSCSRWRSSTNPHAASSKLAESDRLPHPPSPPASLPATSSPTDGNLQRGSAWCHDNTRPAAKPSSDASPNAAMRTCAPC